MKKKQRQTDLSIRFGAFKAPGREGSAVCSSGSGSDLWLWLCLVSRQMSEQAGAAWYQWTLKIGFYPSQSWNRDLIFTSN